MKSLLRVVAEQSEIRPSLTSLTSFTSNIDLEDVYCSNYSISGATNIHSNTVKTPGGKILQDGSFDGEKRKKKANTNHFFNIFMGDYKEYLSEVYLFCIQIQRKGENLRQNFKKCSYLHLMKIS